MATTEVTSHEPHSVFVCLSVSLCSGNERFQFPCMCMRQKILMVAEPSIIRARSVLRAHSCPHVFQILQGVRGLTICQTNKLRPKPLPQSYTKHTSKSLTLKTLPSPHFIIEVEEADQQYHETFYFCHTLAPFERSSD